MANINKEKKYHFTYKTTNLLTGKFYIGVHSTSNLKDNYLGSGKRLRHSIRKYGKECFSLEILEFFDTREKLLAKEKDLVCENLLQDPMCLNLKPGGSGGFCNKEHEIAFRQAAKIAAQTNRNRFEKQKWLKENNLTWNENRINAISKTKKGDPRNKTFLGKKHTEETKKKIGITNSIKQSGSKNSQYGTMWITDGFRSKKIKKNNTLPPGWREGRINAGMS